MKYVITFIFLFLINIFYPNSYASDKKLPLNEEQKNLINKYHLCEEYSQCEFETLIKLIEITDIRYEYFEPILGEFVDRLVLLGDLTSWKKYEYLIDDFLFKNDEGSNTYKFIFRLYGGGDFTV